MSFIAQPAANLHSPTAIGDVAPNTVKATTLTVVGDFLPASNLGSNLGASGTYITTAYIASGVFVFGLDVGIPRSVNVSSTGLSLDSTSVINWYTGASFAGAIDVQLLRTGTKTVSVQDGSGGASAWKAKLTTDTNATTGLGAGLLAATTNATVTLYDGSGQAYRVPCII